MYPADLNYVLPSTDCHEAPEPFRDIDAETEADSRLNLAYEGVEEALDDLRRLQRSDLFLLGYPTLFNPDPRPGPEWSLLAHFDGDAPWFAGVGGDRHGFVAKPNLGSLDFLGCYVRTTDLQVGRLDRVAFCGMLT